MKAAVLQAPGKISVLEVSRPKPNDYQALVRMEVCGICSGTDTRIFEGKKPFSVDYPSILGHEGVGRIVEVGRRVKSFREGDRVLRACAVYPSHTVDGIGSAWGSLAEYGLVTDLETWRKEQPEGEHARFGYGRLQMKVPQDLPAMDACLLITWKEIYSALLLLGSPKGKDVAVVGEGPVGLNFCRWAKELGARSVTVLGLRDDRLDMARRMGADKVIHVGREKLPEERVFDAVVDAVGAPPVIAQMFPRLRDQGRIGLYGMGESFQVEFDRGEGPRVWHLVQINPDEAGCHEEVLVWLKKGTLRAADFVTCVEDLAHVAKALAHLREPGALKSVIRFDKKN